METIWPGFDDGREAGHRCGNKGEPREQVSWKSKVIVLSNKNKRIGRDKCHGGEYGGPDVQIDGATIRLVILVNSEISSERGPELCSP